MILLCLGTRPEVIKLAPVIQEIQRSELPYELVFTGQHQELFTDVAHLIPKPHHTLDVMRHNQTLSSSIAAILQGMDDLIRRLQPKLVVVQGDTSTVLASAMAAFNNRVPIGHVEAGLRTYNLESPFPEEANRQIVSRMATFNWAPTELAKQNLLAEGIRNVEITGNTVVDACLNVDLEVSYGSQVLVTLHRRENFGSKMESIFRSLNQLAKSNPQLSFIFPMHPNPNVQKLKHLLTEVEVINPLNYESMLLLLSKVRFVITDSGGLQEECAAFRKKVLVCRDTTERPEGITAGFARLIGTELRENFDWANDNPEWDGSNPYGDGKASERIVSAIQSSLFVAP